MVTIGVIDGSASWKSGRYFSDGIGPLDGLFADGVRDHRGTEGFRYRGELEDRVLVDQFRLANFADPETLGEHDFSAMNDRNGHARNTAPVHHFLGDAVNLANGRGDPGLGNRSGRVRIRSEVTDVFHVRGDRDVDPIRC